MKIENQQRNNNYNGKIKEKDFDILIKNYLNGDSLVKLSLDFNYNLSTIRYFLIKNSVKIRTVKESVQKFHKQKNIIIDDFLNENLLGWILGDGGLRLSGKMLNPYFIYTDKKLEHIKHIERILNNYNINSNIFQNKKSKCYQLQSESLKEFHFYYNLFYGYKGLNENNQKRKILPNITLTPIILKNWFIGDGSSSIQNKSYNNKGTICCKYKNEFIFNQFRKLFGDVKCYKYSTKIGFCHSYHFNNQSLIKLLKYIGDCPIKEYEYKWVVRRSTTIIESTNMVEGIV
jgi:hypothetical protein